MHHWHHTVGTPGHPATTAVHCRPAAASQPWPRCRGGAHAGPVLGCSEVRVGVRGAVGCSGRQVGAGAGKGGASLHPPSPAQCYCDTRPGSQDTPATLASGAQHHWMLGI